MTRNLLLILVLLGGISCGPEADENREDPWWAELPYALEVLSFSPGEGAGFGEASFPEVVLGPPQGKGTGSGSLDVLSLGEGGEIVLGFGDREIVDGEGPDFIVFENAFWPTGNAEDVFAELGAVAVSVDGDTWHEFPCDFQPGDPPPYPGCAGWTPTSRFDPEAIDGLEVAITGGDAFDLADLGLDRARYVRIRDLWGLGETPIRGFDLDAVGLIHFDEPG